MVNKFLQEQHLFLQSLQPGSWCTCFNGFILQGSARTITTLKSGNFLYAQNIESLGNISTKLRLSVIIGRCFLLIELMLGPGGGLLSDKDSWFNFAFCSFLLNCWSWLVINFFKSSNNLLLLMIARNQVSWIFFWLF